MESKKVIFNFILLILSSARRDVLLSRQSCRGIGKLENFR